MNEKRSSVSQFDVRVSDVVGVNSAQALQRRGGEGDAGRATDVLLPFQLTNTPLENTAEELHAHRIKYTKAFVPQCQYNLIKRSQLVSLQRACANSQENEG